MSLKYKQGVSYDATRRIRKFKSVLKFNGKTVHLGYYRTEDEAHEVFKKAQLLRDNGQSFEQIKESVKAPS
jgi:hypothetical protein